MQWLDQAEHVPVLHSMQKPNDNRKGNRPHGTLLNPMLYFVMSVAERHLSFSVSSFGKIVSTYQAKPFISVSMQFETGDV
jgi:hypothetical protein